MRPSLLTALLLACVPFAASASCVDGAVFLDSNGNGQQDAGERPLAGIRASDGEHYFVSTGKTTSTAARIQPAQHLHHQACRLQRRQAQPTAAGHLAATGR